MTTIVYHQGVLAADSQTTSKNKFHCVECEKEVRGAYCDKTKITTGYKESFRGERIVAIGTVGSVSMSNRSIDIIRKGKDLENVLQCVLDFGSTPLLPFSLVIVTTSKLWKLHYSAVDKKMTTTELDISDFHTFGSGCDSAELAIKMFNVNAVEAVKTAMITDSGTGGNVIWINVNETPDDVVVKTEKFNKKTDITGFMVELTTKIKDEHDITSTASEQA